jgi:hypothetical protein
MSARSSSPPPTLTLFENTQVFHQWSLILPYTKNLLTHPAALPRSAPEAQLSDVLALLSRWLPANMGAAGAGSSPLAAVAGEESRLVASISGLLAGIEGSWSKLQAQLSDAKVGAAGAGAVLVLCGTVLLVCWPCATPVQALCAVPAVLPA